MAFDATGLQIDGALRVNSTSEVQLISNVNLDTIADWYEGYGAPTHPITVFTNNNNIVLDVAAPGSLAVSSKKFPVSAGELIRVSGLLNVTGYSAPTIGTPYIEVQVMFSSNPALLSDSVNFANYTDSIYVVSSPASEFVRASESDLVPFSDVVQVPAGAVWASVFVMAEHMG